VKQFCVKSHDVKSECNYNSLCNRPRSICNNVIYKCCVRRIRFNSNVRVPKWCHLDRILEPLQCAIFTSHRKSKVEPHILYIADASNKNGYQSRSMGLSLKAVVVVPVPVGWRAYRLLDALQTDFLSVFFCCGLHRRYLNAFACTRECEEMRKRTTVCVTIYMTIYATSWAGLTGVLNLLVCVVDVLKTRKSSLLVYNKNSCDERWKTANLLDLNYDIYANVLLHGEWLTWRNVGGVCQLDSASTGPI